MRFERCWLGLSLVALAAAGCAKHSPPGEGVAAAASKTVGAHVTDSARGLSPAAEGKAPAPSSPQTRLPQTEVTWSYGATPVGPMNAVVVIPERAEGERFPVLVTFHGTGEAHKGPERGARGWIDDYGLYRAIERLHHPPLTPEDLQGFVDAERLDKLNAALAEHPYRGLVIVNSYTPDMLRGDEPFSKVPPLARFVVDELLPRAARETPAMGTPETTGIDGVSLGGRAALAIGLVYPEAFGSIGGLQPAFDVENAQAVASRAALARQRNPKLRFRLLTSDEDYFLAATKAMSAAMKSAGVPHSLVVVPGPHDYPFNRGPAVYEMLLHHDRVLRGLAPI